MKFRQAASAWFASLVLGVLVALQPWEQMTSLGVVIGRELAAVLASIAAYAFMMNLLGWIGSRKVHQ